MDHPQPPPPQSRLETIHLELEATKKAYHQLVDSVPETVWRAPSNNPAWTNAELLFHITLAPRLVPEDLAVIRRGWQLPLPPAWLFNRLNALFAHLGGRNLSRTAAHKKYDAAHLATLRALDTVRDDEWELGLTYPDWDPLLSGFVSVERLFHYPKVHFDSHTGDFLS